MVKLATAWSSVSNTSNSGSTRAMFITWTTRSRGWSALRAPPARGDAPRGRDEFAEAGAVDRADPAEIDDDAGAPRVEEHVHGLP